MAWSGDMSSPADKPTDFHWTLADEGGMLWTDNMAIPKGAPNKSRPSMIDFYYDPKNAAQIEAYVNYVCPVVGADEVMLDDRPRPREQPADLPAGRSWPSSTQVRRRGRPRSTVNDQYATVAG